MGLFTIEGQFDTASEYFEMGKGSLVEIHGKSPGVLPLMLATAGRYTFNDTSVGKVLFQNVQVPVLSTPSAAPISIPGFQSQPFTNDEIVIAALVSMMGGSVSISEHEMRAAASGKNMIAKQIPNLDGTERFVITVTA